MTEIYLDSAATSLHKPPQVAQAVAEAICKAGNAARGAHGASLSALRTVYDTRCLAARLLGCPRPDHVVFAANSTMALNIAICGLLSPGDHAISTDLEHNSVLRPLYALQRQGMALSFVPADKNGQVSYDALERLFRPNTRAVVCTHASNVTGDAVNSIRSNTGMGAIGRPVRSRGGWEGLSRSCSVRCSRGWVAPAHSSSRRPPRSSSTTWSRAGCWIFSMRVFSTWAAVSRTTALRQMASSGMLLLLHHPAEQLVDPVVSAL